MYLDSFILSLHIRYFVLILKIIFYYAPVLSMCRNINFLSRKCSDAVLEARQSSQAGEGASQEK